MVLSKLIGERLRLVIVEHLVGYGDELLPVTVTLVFVDSADDDAAISECALHTAGPALLPSFGYDMGHSLVDLEVLGVNRLRCGHSEEVNSSRRAGESMMA